MGNCACEKNLNIYEFQPYLQARTFRKASELWILAVSWQKDNTQFFSYICLNQPQLFFKQTKLKADA